MHEPARAVEAAHAALETVLDLWSVSVRQQQVALRLW